MQPIYSTIEARLKGCANPDEARHLMRFFKTAPGEYGEGDRFLGIRVPVTRSVVNEFKKDVTVDDVRRLVESPWHEVRLAGFLSLIEVFKRHKKRKDEEGMRDVVDFYLSVIDRGNNWDLVDLVAPKILGEWLTVHKEERGVLHQLAGMDGRLWHQRVAIVANWTLIRAGEYDDTIRISERFLTHSHDLIHKATGWMLREIGKRGGMDVLTAFLDSHSKEMPRTMLRYAIEQLPEHRRRHYLVR